MSKERGEEGDRRREGGREGGGEGGRGGDHDLERDMRETVMGWGRRRCEGVLTL